MFVEKPSCWRSNSANIVALFASFTITNPNQEGGNLLVVRVQIRRSRFILPKKKEDAWYVVIGKEVMFPGRVGIVVETRTSTVLYIQHSFNVEQVPPGDKKLAFEIMLTDQFNRHHVVSIKVPKCPIKLAAA